MNPLISVTSAIAAKLAVGLWITRSLIILVLSLSICS